MSSLCKIPGPGFSNLPLQLLQRSPFWPSSITLRPPHFYSAAKISSLSLCSDHVTPLHDVPPLAPRALLDPEQTPCSPSKATMALSSPLASCHLSAHGLQSSSPTTLYDLTSPVLLKRVRPFLWLPPPPMLGKPPPNPTSTCTFSELPDTETLICLWLLIYLITYSSPLTFASPPFPSLWRFPFVAAYIINFL